MMRIRTILTAAAGLALFAIAQPAHAINIANFNQNPSSPPGASGFSITSGVDNFVGASIPIDYTFLVPPNNTTAFGGGNAVGTAKALLTVGPGGLVLGSAVEGPGGNITQNVDFQFTIVNSNVDPLANANLLSGRLFGVLNVAGNNLTQATMNLLGLSWNSTVQYDVGGGPLAAQFLAGYTASWTLNVASAPITVTTGGNINPVRFQNITGGFATTPEPASMVMLGLGLAAIPAVSLVRRRFAKA